MSPPSSKAKFTQGPVMRHVVVMTAAGSVGLMAVFFVDLLNLFYIAALGEEELAAAIGYAETVLFFSTSFGVGIMIGGGALLARAIGAGERARARRIATAAMLYMFIVMVALTLVSLHLLGPALTRLGAAGRTHAIALDFLIPVTLATPLLGVGLAASGLLRATGDAQRAMWVTLGGGIVTAILDPILILWLGYGVPGAAAASVATWLFMAGYGLYALAKVHRLIAPAPLRQLFAEFGPISAIAVPAVLTNVATPVGNAYVTAALAPFGTDAVAAWAVIGRITPVCFAPLFAMSGAVGPIFGQNLGARMFDRLRIALRDSLSLALVYVLVVWALLALSRDLISQVFGLGEVGAEIITWFCLAGAGSFVFMGALFVANAAFNNLGAPILSTGFNWGRATLGTFPLVALGAAWYGAPGVVVGQAVGSIVFGLAAIVMAFRVVEKVARTAPRAEDVRPSIPEMPPLASPQDASAIDP